LCEYGADDIVASARLLLLLPALTQAANPATAAMAMKVAAKPAPA